MNSATATPLLPTLPSFIYTQVQNIPSIFLSFKQTKQTTGDQHSE